MVLRKILFLSVLLGSTFQLSKAAHILIPMDSEQQNHLKAYGITYWVIDQGIDAWWLLNYQGGAFAFRHSPIFEKECLTRGVKFTVIPDGVFDNILTEISNPEANMDAIKLEKTPKIAVYTPDFNSKGEEVQPWDDAVTMVLTYAEIPYETIYDKDVMNDELVKYDWLHLHHEDFTGQYGKFYRNYHAHAWYRENQKKMEQQASELGFVKVSQLKLAVAKKIKEYIVGGGFMFAMCSATDTYDIALAAEGVDICAAIYDGDPADPKAQSKLDFSKTLAFTDFTLIKDPQVYEHSSIDNKSRKVPPEIDYFTLFDFSAKWDHIPTMLTQNHTRTVKGFMGQSTTFRNGTIKPGVLVLGENKSAAEAKYIHGIVGKGQFTFYGGHDPEDYRHFVGDPDTDLELHPNSPGYRLILNNVLFPAAKKKKQKT